MAIRSMLLPAVTLALPFLVNACGNEPTSPLNRTGGPQASASVVGPGPAPLKLQPVAGNFTPPDFKFTGNATYSQAQWTNKVALDGKFSVLLEKSVDFIPCAATLDNGCAAFAAAIVDGVEEMTIAQLGTIGFSVNGTCGAGAPRFNLYYDTNGDGEAEGVAFYGCAAHVSGASPPDWTSMSVTSAFPAVNCYSFAAPFVCTLTLASTVVQLSVLVDEKGTWYIDRVIAAGHTTGEPNGGN